jgi:hypothetical protein
LTAPGQPSNGHPSDWPRLFRIACSLIDQVNSKQSVIDGWTFGGGTAMMLQVGHRDSHDVDIFLTDAQYLGLLDPDKNDFEFEVLPTGYNGDGTGFLKLAFEGIGQIDFIVGQAMTSAPTTARIIEGRPVLLETVPEIITKKIYHRGAGITARDIFDIAAGAVGFESEIVRALKDYKPAVKKTLERMEKLNPEFVAASIASLAMRDEYRETAPIALQRAREILSSV